MYAKFYNKKREVLKPQNLPDIKLGENHIVILHSTRHRKINITKVKIFTDDSEFVMSIDVNNGQKELYAGDSVQLNFNLKIRDNKLIYD